MQSAEHEEISTYLRALFRERFANDPTTIVLGDVLVDWATDEMRGHGPDVAIIFNVQQKQNWSTFREAEEGTKPSLIIEVTAPFTYSVDLETKVAHYAEVGVEWYVIVDIVIRRGMPTKRLLGYQLTEDGYKRFEPNEKGWLWLAPVNLWLGWRDEAIACYDAAGNLVDIGNSRVAESQSRATAAEQRADDAEQRADAAEQRAGDEAQARAAAEQARAAAEQRADDEARDRQQLEAELRRLRGEANNK